MTEVAEEYEDESDHPMPEENATENDLDEAMGATFSSEFN